VEAKFPLGTLVRDTITGYTGIAIGRTEFLPGCVRIAVQSQELKDGKPIDPQYFDEPQLAVIELTPAKEPVAVTGGPRDAGSFRRPDATR
jgi:hypothetical protein